LPAAAPRLTIGAPDAGARRLIGGGRPMRCGRGETKIDATGTPITGTSRRHETLTAPFGACWWQRRSVEHPERVRPPCSRGGGRARTGHGAPQDDHVLCADRAVTGGGALCFSQPGRLGSHDTACSSNRSKPSKQWWWRQTTGSTGSLTALAYRTPCACSVDPEGCEGNYDCCEHASCALLLAAEQKVALFYSSRRRPIIQRYRWNKLVTASSYSIAKLDRRKILSSKRKRS